MTDKHISFTVSNPTGLTSDRIVGYDFARSMALLGMVIVNYKMVMIDTGPHPEWLLWIVERIEGRAAAMFVMLAEKMNQNWLKPFATVGRMSFTLYVIHVTIGIEGLDYMGLYMDSQSLWIPTSIAIGFYVFSIGFAHVWEKTFGRGPLEALMRKIRLLKIKTQIDNDVIIV